jgi:hypothetical protein
VRTSRRAPTRFVLDPSLTRFAYRCPDGCPRGRTCCVGLVVEVSRREVRVIDSLMDELAALAPRLRSDDGSYASVFVQDDSDLLIESDDDGVCPFMHRTTTRTLCAIHTVALQTGRDVSSVKPAACRHWPITLVADGSGCVRVTVQPAARRIGCVAPTRDLPGHPTVLESFRAEIEEICGCPLDDLAQSGGRAGKKVGRR